MTKIISRLLYAGYHFRTGSRHYFSLTSFDHQTLIGHRIRAQIGNQFKSLGRTLQFLVTSFGILFFFIVYGYLQGPGSPTDFFQPELCGQILVLLVGRSEDLI